jgi:flavocytochrome c
MLRPLFLLLCTHFLSVLSTKHVAATSTASKTDTLRLDLIHQLSSTNVATPRQLEHLLAAALQRAQQPDLAPVVVVGGGLSGLTSALRLLEAGAPVTLVDKRLFWGGNSAKASSGINGGYTANQKNLGIDDSADQFYEDTMACSGRTNGSLTERLIRRMSDDSQRAVEWIEQYADVELPDVGQLGGHSNARTHRPRNRLAGAAFISGLERAVLKYRKSGLLTVLKGHRMVKLLPVEQTTSKAGDPEPEPGQDVSLSPSTGLWDLHLEVVGGSPVTVRASAVVLATGGYANDKGQDGSSLLKEVTPHLMTLRSTNGEFATGDGIKVARELGAGTIDLDMVQVHPTGFSDAPTGFKEDPNNPNSPLVLAAEILRGVGSVLLNSKGERFVNELQTRKFVVEQMKLTGEKQFVLVLPPASASKVEAHVNIYTGKGLLTPVEGLEGVAQYVRTRLNGQSEHIAATFATTTDGTHPVPRNRPTSLPKTGTYHVGVVQPVLHYTMGGLAVDTEGRVMDTSNVPMPGLYGAGEIMGGVHGENRLGGSSLLDCVVFGLASADHILTQYPLLTTGGATGTTGATGVTGDASDVVEEYAVAPTDQLRVKIEERHYDLSRFVDLHPGGALMVANGEDLTTRFKEAHGDDWNLFDRDEITQVTEEGHRVAEKDKPQVKEHRTANYGSKGGSWREIVGRRTWFFLHSLAAKYPDNPSDNDKESVRNLVAALGQHYPCKLCRKHLKQQLRELRPIAVNTRQELTVWFCELHNMVNKDIGHKQFDCNPFHLDMEYLKDCGECEVVKNDGTDASKALEKAKSGYHPETGPWDSSLYQRDPLLLSSITSVTDAWEAKDADDMLQAMKTLGIVDKKTFQQLRDRLRLGVDARNDMLDVLTDAMMVAKKAVMADASGKALNK